MELPSKHEVKEGWTKVKYNKTNRRREGTWDTEGRVRVKGSCPTSTFFFTEFEEKLGVKDFYRVFAEFGDIDEVIIPSKRKKVGQVSQSDEDNSVRFSGGEVMCCDSISDSDVVRCNSRVWSSMKSDVERVVWDIINKLGLVSKDQQDQSVKIIEAMELRDKEGKALRENAKAQLL